ncbi:MAG: hypothetical protein U0V87_02055 [Acidobacteriota bacterium]
MKPIDINLSAQPYRNDTPLWIGLALVVAAALGFAVYNGWYYTTSNQRIEALTAELAGHRQKMETMSKENEKLTNDLKAVDADLYATQVEFVNEILTQRNFSWTRLFNALEDVVPWDVRLTAIRPVFEQARVAIQVSGVSRNYDALLKFEEEVERYPQFDGLTPGDFNRGDAGDQIYFNLSFNYRPDAVEELPAEGEISTANQSPATSSDTPGSDKTTLASRGEPSDATNDTRARAIDPAGMRDARYQSGEPSAMNSTADAAANMLPGRGMNARPVPGDPRAQRAGRGRPDSDGPSPLEDESTFGGEFIAGQGSGARGNGNAPTATPPGGRAPRTADANGNDPRSNAGNPADSDRPRRPSIDPSQYVTYDQDGKPVLHPFTRDNPPPKKDGGGGQP